MKKDNVLVNVALLSTLFEDSNKDNISLLLPFVKHIIFKFSNNVDDEIIIKEMESTYAFSNFPHAILRILLNKLKKSGVISQKEKKYVLIKDISNEMSEFDNRYTSAKIQIETIVEEFIDYVYENTKNRISFSECKDFIAKFLDLNGYVLYGNVNLSNKIDSKKDLLTYSFGQFICFHKEQNDKVFEYLKNIIEGALLANALYVNVEGNDFYNLNKLTCYLDTLFILRVLEFKDFDSNKSAVELFNLLMEQKVKVKCFTHNFKEVENSIEDFIRNYGKPQERTLERFVVENYSLTEVQDILNSLKNLFFKKGIEIVDTPPYLDKEKGYDCVIGHEELTNKLISVYTNKNIKRETIERDVESVSAIMRLRKNKECRRLEDCTAIFVTTNIDIKREANSFLKLDETFKVGPVVSDVDLTAVIWLKSLITNKNIPELKLIENAIAAIKPSPYFQAKYHTIVENMKSREDTPTKDTLFCLLYSKYYSQELMEKINGDPNSLTPQKILGTYEQTIKNNELLKNSKKMIDEKNKRLVEQLLNKEAKENNMREKINKKYNDKIESLKKLIITIENIIIFILACLWGYLAYIFATSGGSSKNEIFACFFLLLSSFSIISLFLPISLKNILKYLFVKINNKLFIKITSYYNKKEDAEISWLFSDK